MSYDVTFDGTNGSPWPGYAAPVLSSGSGGFADLQNNEGRFRFNDTGGYNNRVKIERSMGAEVDGIVFAAFRVPTSRPDIAVEFSIRGSGIQPTHQGPPASSYTLTIQPAANVLHFWRQQNEGLLVTMGRDDAYIMSGGDIINVRMSTAGTMIRCKVWRNSEPEPSAWRWEYTDASPLPAGTDHISMRGESTFNSGNVFFLRHTRISLVPTSPPPPVGVWRSLGRVSTSATGDNAVSFNAPTPGTLLISAVGIDKSAGASILVPEPGWRVLGTFMSADVSGAVALKSAVGNETTMTWRKGTTGITSTLIGQISNTRFAVSDAVAYVPAIDPVANLTAENSASAAPADGLAIAYHSVDTTWDGLTSDAWPVGYPTFTNGYVLQDKYVGIEPGAAGIAIAMKRVLKGESLATSVTINNADQSFVGIIFIPYVSSRVTRTWKKPGATTANTDDTLTELRKPLAITPAVVNIAATSLSSKVVLTWDVTTTSVAPTSFLIGRDGTDSNGVGDWSTTVPGTQRSYAFESLVNGASYNVYVEPIAGTQRGTRATRTAVPQAQVTGRDAPSQPTISGTVPAHMIGTWDTIFEDDFDDPAITAQKWNLNRDSYHTTNGWWTQDKSGMQVPPQTDALEFIDSTVWLKATRRTNPTGQPFVNAILTTGRPTSAYGTPCKFAIPKNSTTFTEGLFWSGTARGTLSGFRLLGNTTASDPFDVNGSPTKGFNATGGAVWGQTTAGWPTGGEAGILEFVENNTSERHRPFSSLHWAKDYLTNPPGTWGSREFLTHPDSRLRQRPDLQNSWHKWGLYRSPTLMVVYIDGVEICRWVRGNTYTSWDGVHTPAPVDWTGDVYLFLSYSIGGSWGGQGWTDTQLDEGRFGVKYIKVWQLPTAAQNTASAPTSASAAVLSVPSATGYTATLTWQPPASTGASPITGYTVARDGTDTSGAGSWSTTISDPSVRSFSFTKLAARSTYNLTVRAINGAGPGPAATVSVVIPG